VHTIAARTRADSESSVALEEGGRGRTLTSYPKCPSVLCNRAPNGRFRALRFSYWTSQSGRSATVSRRPTPC